MRHCHFRIEFTMGDIVKIARATISSYLLRVIERVRVRVIEKVRVRVIERLRVRVRVRLRVRIVGSAECWLLNHHISCRCLSVKYLLSLQSFYISQHYSESSTLRSCLCLRRRPVREQAERVERAREKVSDCSQRRAMKG